MYDNIFIYLLYFILLRAGPGHLVFISKTVKVRSYTVRYPVLGTAQSFSLHPPADLFISTPTQHLWEVVVVIVVSITILFIIYC